MANRFQAGGVMLGLLVLWLLAIQTQAATIIFKDGFVVSGKVRQQQELIIDPASGAGFRIPAAGGFFYVDDEVRRILFSPSQVQEVTKEDPPGKNELMRLSRHSPSLAGYNALPSWQIDTITPWSPNWGRVVKMNTDLGRLDINQRLTVLTPFHARIDSLRYDWSPCHLLGELGPDLVRSLLYQFYEDKKDLKEPEKRLFIVRFLYQAGWLDEAQKELDKLLQDHPDQKGAAATYQDALKKLTATLFVEALLRAHKVGQHQQAQDKLARFFKEDYLALVGDQQLVAVQELKNKYEAARTKLQQLQQALKEFPTRVAPSWRAFFTQAAKTISKDLNVDTLPRLETFLVYAQQYQRDLQEQRKLSHSAEGIMALALSGWVLGDAAAEPEAKTALLLWQVRQLLLAYHQEGDDGKRGQQIQTLVQSKAVTVEILARVIGLLPPPLPHEVSSTLVTKLEIELPQGGIGGTYYVQLPPEYHAQRAYPVLLLLHGGREKANVLITRWSALAAQQGFILAAPVWGSGIRPMYQHSNKEHTVVLDCLRDLRRRFQVDSDRVFLFGWEQGADMAYDVGLSHPDQFAGVLPMNGNPRYFAQKYWPNGQYLPFYVVEGDMNGLNPKANRTLFKDWIRWNYPAMYLEYKGRGSEWFEGELPLMMDWMARKKRAQPQRELGRAGVTVISGEEFKTMRHGDNRFYWLSTEAINDSCINSSQNWNPRCSPATLQGSTLLGNRLAVKAGAKSADIWNQINVRTSGVKQVSIWLGPNHIDFSKPLLLRVNSQQVGRTALVTPSWQTLLEDLFLQGDRQRLFVARIDVKL